MSRASELREARDQERKAGRTMVLLDLRWKVENHGKIAREWRADGIGEAYRREIARLWRVALRAVVADGWRGKR